MNTDFHAWRKELLLTGDIVPDRDTSVSSKEAEQRFTRYVEMVYAVRGNEGIETFIALVDSLQSDQDYGAYQSTFSALWRFPARVSAQGLLVALPRLMKRRRDSAGDILGQLANNWMGEDGPNPLTAFRDALALTDAETRKTIMDFVAHQEDEGWLDGRRKGVIRPSRAEVI